MKYLLVMVILLGCFTIVTSQDMSFVDGEIEKELTEKIDQKKSELAQKYNNGYLMRDEIIEFSIDTFRIETELDMKLARTENMFDRELALNDAVYAYNRLVGKYVDLLGNLLNEPDKKTLKQSQMSWLQYKRHEFRLIESMAKLEYPEGKIADNIYITRRVKELNKNRVAELFNYYMMMAGK